jgi:predicted phosphodiesterase
MGKRSFSFVAQTDTHYPYQDEAALACFFAAVAEVKPDLGVITGDLIDAATFSRWDPKTFKEAEAYSFKEKEIDPANANIDYLLKYCKKVIYVAGNHEGRVQTAAVKLGRLGAGIHDLISPKVLLSAGRSKREFQWIDYHEDFKKAHYKITPRLLALHGLSTAKHAPAKHLEKLKSYSVVYGHTHRRQSDTRRDPISDLVHEAMSGGCLSTLAPKYMHGNPNEWAHGCTLGYCRFDGTKHTLYNIGIEHGQCVLPSGKTVKG